jgi:hypothetical protein
VRAARVPPPLLNHGCGPAETGSKMAYLAARRTLAKLEAAGLIRTKAIGRRKAPSAAIMKIVVEIDPYSERDRVRGASSRCKRRSRGSDAYSTARPERPDRLRARRAIAACERPALR